MTVEVKKLRTLWIVYSFIDLFDSGRSILCTDQSVQGMLAKHKPITVAVFPMPQYMAFFATQENSINFLVSQLSDWVSQLKVLFGTQNT